MNDRNGVTIKIRYFAKFKSQLKACCLYWWLLVAILATGAGGLHSMKRAPVSVHKKQTARGGKPN